MRGYSSQILLILLLCDTLAASLVVRIVRYSMTM